jgi:hypothetical protein
MKYQVRLCLGNYDTWEEANDAKIAVLSHMSMVEKDAVIESRVVDSNTTGYGI